MLVPVLDKNNIPLMPCSNARARLLMKSGDAKPWYQKGIFCIKLLREPSARNYQKVALGIDPGSKREGYTVATETKVVMNITSNTPDWVKGHVETRRALRQTRRARKTPYRKCRFNRASSKKEGRVPPSTKARWDAKLRVISILKRILPITIINVEDIKASPKEGDKKWNKSFSPLEVGKKYFYNEVSKLSNIILIKTEGFETHTLRVKRGFEKSKAKLEYIWEAHNVDSHILCEIALKKKIIPYKGIIKLKFLEYYRRQLHVQIPIKNNVRKQYGGTVSLGLSRGSIVKCTNKKYKGKIFYLGGTSNGRLTIHDIKTGIRIARNIKKENINILYINKIYNKY